MPPSIRTPILVALGLAVACQPPPEHGKRAAFAIGGTLFGLEGSGLVLRNNGIEELRPTADGPFAFETPIPDGSGYHVSVATQPTQPRQTCTVEDGSGIVAGESVSDARVHCETESFTIGGVVIGLRGSGLVLRNDGDDLAITDAGAFTFPSTLRPGERFDVSIAAQPTNPSQTCRMGGARGTVASGNVTSITVECSTDRFLVGGRVDGLAGEGLVLDLGGRGLLVTSNGDFAFETTLPSGASYEVTVKSQPLRPSQTCFVDNATGTVGDTDVDHVLVTCTTNGYRVGGRVTGLLGGGLVLRLDGGEELALEEDGPFLFRTPVASGRGYRVSVKAHPPVPPQVCVVERGVGSVSSDDVSTVEVSCAERDTWAVGGVVTGLVGSGLTLRLNGANELAIAANGAFRWVHPRLRPGDRYEVDVVSQPVDPLQHCEPARASGTIGTSNVTNVGVTCISDRLVSGNVTGLVGRGLVLRNNGGDQLVLEADGRFTFPTPVAIGDAYEVTIAGQPNTPAQVCEIVGGAASGTVGATVVPSIEIVCAPPDPVVGFTEFVIVNRPIPDHRGDSGCQVPNTPVQHSIAVPAAEKWPVRGVSVALELTHPWIGDLRATLTHEPSNITVVLFDTIGALLPGDPEDCGDSSDVNGEYQLIDDAATTLADAATLPECGPACLVHPGRYRAPGVSGTGILLGASAPQGFGGLTAAGAWRLDVSDQAGGNEGMLRAWTLTLTR